MTKIGYVLFIVLCIVSALFIAFGNEDMFVIGLSYYGVVGLFKLVSITTPKEVKNTYKH